MMQALKRVRIIDNHILSIDDKKEVAARVEPHALAVLHLDSFIRTELVMQDVIEPYLVNE